MEYRESGPYRKPARVAVSRIAARPWVAFPKALEDWVLLSTPLGVGLAQLFLVVYSLLEKDPDSHYPYLITGTVLTLIGTVGAFVMAGFRVRRERSS